MIYIMKPKTFTYNQIIKLFSEHNLPLTKNQYQLITMLNRKDMARLEKYREERKKKLEYQRTKRKITLITNTTV